MTDSLRSCATCVYWDGDAPVEGRRRDPHHPPEGRCRRHAPAAVLGSASRGPEAGDAGSAASWPLTLAQDWCGEWRPRETLLVEQEPLIEQEPPLGPEEERSLRNASIAEALLVLPPEKRDRLLLEVLTDEERGSPTPPDDFYERVQSYLARPRDGEAGWGT